MYKNICVAVSLEEGTGTKVVKAAQSLLASGGSCHVIYVVDPRYLQYTFDLSPAAKTSLTVQQNAIAGAAERVRALCEPLGVGVTDISVVSGYPASEIRRYAADNDCDLIVMGTHGRRGWRRVLGSVASEVLHGTPTNVFLCRSAVIED